MTIFLTIVLIIIVSLATVEYFVRMTKIPSIVIRKIIHVGLAMVVVLASLLFGYRIFIVIGLISSVFFALSRNLYKLRCLRDRKNKSWGEVFFPLGVAASAIISINGEVFIASILILALSDTAAFIVGKNFPNSRKIITGRTVVGSGAGFIVSLVIMLLLGFGAISSMLVSFGIFIVEVFSIKGSDNFTMPVMAAILLNLLV